MIKIVTANEQNEKLERRKEKSNQMQAHDWHASKIENVGLGSEVLLNMISYSNEKYRANVEKVILHWAMKKKIPIMKIPLFPYTHTHTHRSRFIRLRLFAGGGDLFFCTPSSNR